MKLRPRSLLGRAAVTIALTLLLFMVISFGAATYFVFIPMSQRSADDFAAEVVSAAYSLRSLPPDMHPELRQQLLIDHGLIVGDNTKTDRERLLDVPYFDFFRQSLARRTGQDLPLFESEHGRLLWVDIPTQGQTFRLGFDPERAGTNPPLALILVISGGAVLTLLASILEVRRVERPLTKMSTAVAEVGRGRRPPPLPENGADEIATLARAFNRMSSDLNALSENRAVIIAGLSHDLRTPLTRLELAVEMLDESSNPELLAGIRRNLAAMNSLIEQFLQFSRGIEETNPVELDHWDLIRSQAADLIRAGATIRLHRHNPPCVYLADRTALARVLSNLLDNAAHYGGGKPIDVELHCTEQSVCIEISDRGPGIPADQIEAAFRPFHRLETARSKRTGGSGLGLAIARQLALKHDWTIELLPRDGGGTIARLSLPPAFRRCAHVAEA